jgi:hypothetical protein
MVKWACAVLPFYLYGVLPETIRDDIGLQRCCLSGYDVCSSAVPSLTSYSQSIQVSLFLSLWFLFPNQCPPTPDYENPYPTLSDICCLFCVIILSVCVPARVSSLQAWSYALPFCYLLISTPSMYSSLLSGLILEKQSLQQVKEILGLLARRSA